MTRLCGIWLISMPWHVPPSTDGSIRFTSTTRARRWLPYLLFSLVAITKLPTILQNCTWPRSCWYIAEEPNNHTQILRRMGCTKHLFPWSLWSCQLWGIANRRAVRYLQEVWLPKRYFHLTLVDHNELMWLRFAGHYELPPYTNDTMRSVYHVREFEVFKLKQVCFKLADCGPMSNSLTATVRPVNSTARCNAVSWLASRHCQVWQSGSIISCKTFSSPRSMNPVERESSLLIWSNLFRLNQVY